jgi:hypothetical protein
LVCISCHYNIFPLLWFTLIIIYNTLRWVCRIELSVIRKKCCG